MAVELVLRTRLDALMHALPAAAAGDVSGVHRARVASRRVRAAIPLLRGQAARRLERTTRRLTRALGPVRELDVTIGIVDTLEADRALTRAAASALRQALGAERQRLRTALGREIERVDLPKVKKKILAAAHDRSRPNRSDTQARLDAAVKRAARRADRLRVAIETAAGIYLSDRLHDVRIAVKKLRYALEIVRDLRRSRATARINALKAAQDLLGRMHDLEVLIARTRALQGSPNAPNLRVSADLDALVRRLETECRRLHGQYMSMRPALLTIGQYATADAGRRHRTAA